jgi:hypothetical protein
MGAGQSNGVIDAIVRFHLCRRWKDLRETARGAGPLLNLISP